MEFFSSGRAVLLWLVVNSMTTLTVIGREKESKRESGVTVIDTLTEYESTAYCSTGSYCLDMTEEDDKFECKCDVVAPVCWMPEYADGASCIATFEPKTDGYIFTQPNN
ncbi:uncharacterized protein LOC142349334 [Convolutriloba macropyga]|uniref:uncharacterized protein LOC142349334 n=1 Tax=Convolutriloba macropyga TaxID=536237 RepID=UPI003F5232DF